MRAFFRASVMLLLTGFAAGRAGAQLSPGELSRAHAELDSSRACLECHSAGKGVSRELCLSCHGLLRGRIEAGAGLHAGPDYQRCETCHIEHQGRDFELVWWGEAGLQAFDHDTVGYPLAGAHRLECRRCHQASRIADPGRLVAAGKDLDRTFLGLGVDCEACHQDPHRGQMAARGCAECHGEDAWRPAIRFDHDRTNFALDGRHLRVDCAKCHATETDDLGSWARYRTTATGCADCHQDPHLGRLGRDCAVCHTTANWQQVDRGRFDHDRTRYPLRGRHAKVDCAGCHRGGSFRVAGFVPAPPAAGLAGDADCALCHTDAHVGQLGARGGVSLAPVTGSGIALAPVAGGGVAMTPLPDDIAPVSSGPDCAECHDVNGFTPSRFDLADHAETRFPLDLAHRAVPCVSCHPRVPTGELVARGVAVAAAGAPASAQVFAIEVTGCADCHRDPHAGSADAFLGEAGCQRCHDGQGWVAVAFDHGATDFSLEGAHRIVACANCHPASGRGTVEVRLSFQGAPSACRSCHQDPHLSQFDRPGAPAACRDCHSLEGWAPSLFDHGAGSAFPLEGAHARVPCAACHLREVIEGREVVRYRPLPKACSSCHRTLPAWIGVGPGDVAG